MDLAAIVSAYLEQGGRNKKPNAYQAKVLSDITACHTPALGGHIMACPHCGQVKACHNSCGNRNCPSCGGYKRDKWALERKHEAIPVKYFHVVFTVPCELNPLFLAAPSQMYSILFKSAWQTIEKFSKDSKYLGAQMGMVAVLHTWGQNLGLHPHVHCLVPGGGITQQGKWREMKKSKGKFLFPVKALSVVFKAKFLAGTSKLYKKGKIRPPGQVDNFYNWIDMLHGKKWVVFAKKPVPRGKKIIEYLARYTHKTAIGNSRIKGMENGKVRFSYFNYKTSKAGEMELGIDEFIRRFLQHVPPKGFVKIRHYGFLANRNKKHCLQRLSVVLGMPTPKSLKGIPWTEAYLIIYDHHPHLCQGCKKGIMVVIETLPSARDGPRGKGQKLTVRH